MLATLRGRHTALFLFIVLVAEILVTYLINREFGAVCDEKLGHSKSILLDTSVLSGWPP